MKCSPCHAELTWSLAHSPGHWLTHLDIDFTWSVARSPGHNGSLTWSLAWLPGHWLAHLVSGSLTWSVARSPGHNSSLTWSVAHLVTVNSSVLMRSEAAGVVFCIKCYSAYLQLNFCSKITVLFRNQPIEE